MKAIIFVISGVLLVLLGFSRLRNTSDIALRESPKQSVASFWSLAVQGKVKEIDSLLIEIPESYWKASSRCATQEVNKNSIGLSIGPAQGNISASRQKRAILDKIAYIRQQRLELLAVKEERAFSSEAVILATYGYKGSGRETEGLECEFALFKGNDGWRIFMISEGRSGINQDYAAQCHK
jgi:hypothetical protein